MFTGHFAESKEEKIEVDFPVAGFHNIMMMLFGKIFNLNISTVLPTLNVTGYLCIDELKQLCLDFFSDIFTIKRLPIVLKSLDDRGNFPGFLDLDFFDCFIEKYFLKIASTTTFLNLPLATIEYICKLNLIVDSEYQVYHAIKCWTFDNINKKMPNLKQLLKCIRWCHVDQNEMNTLRWDIMWVLDHHDMPMLNCLPSNCDCGKKRTKSKSLIVIHDNNGDDDTDTDTISISYYDENLQLFVFGGHYKLDKALPNELITNGRFADIIFDSGRQGIRINWDLRMYNYLEMIGKIDSHYGEILKYIFPEESHVEIDDKPRGIMLAHDKPTTNADSIVGNQNAVRMQNKSTRKLKESNPIEKYSGALDSVVDDGSGYKLITFHQNLYYVYPYEYNWAEFQFQPNPSTQSLQIDDILYVITQDPGNAAEFCMRKYNQSTMKFTMSPLGAMMYLPDSIDKIELVNHNGKLLLCNKFLGSIYCYNNFNEIWDLLYQIVTPDGIIAVASIFLPNNLSSN